MNINLMRLKPLVKELHGIREEIARLADCWEIELAQSGINIRPPKADTSGPEPTIEYTDEEADELRERLDWLRREDERLAKKEQDGDET